MDKEDIFLINFALVWALFFSNIIFVLTRTNARLVLIAEIFVVPFLYLSFYIIGKLVDKGVLK